ncbi:MAG TPA: TetR/AcrR family transcriptional regulator [Candidatus Sulfotelmatobacter sp.]|nr:TetR/AcrR family transcriptional regulator [Candidatus Sulfotelmatobacter sp.]
MSPRPRVAPQRRRQIVEALFRCMARSGYGQVTITDIAREARVARGAINFFFRSKAEILRALLARAVADYHAALRPILAGSGPADRQMRAVLEALLAPTPQTRRAMLVFLNYYALAPATHDLAAPLRDFFREYRRVFALILRRGMRQGCYPRATDPDAAAAVLVAAVEGLLLQWVVDRNAVDLAQSVVWLERRLAAPAAGRPAPSRTNRTFDGARDR